MAAPGGRRSILWILLLVAPVAACTTDSRPSQEVRPDATSVVVHDAEGRVVEFYSTPDRVVSLVPSASRTLIALGASDLLVGRTEFDTVGVLASLPSVGAGLHPTLEILLSLEPDLVIRFAGQTDTETPSRLDEIGVAHLSVAPESVEDVKRMITDLGTVVGRTPEARSLVERTDSTLADVRSQVANLDPVRVAWVVGGDPPWVSGPGTFIHDLLTAAGGENVFGDLGRLWGAISHETLVARQPDVILTVEGTRLDPRITRRIPVRTVSAAVSLPGPDLPGAAQEIAEALHPNLRPRP